jgi:hypothetical protein
MRGLLPADVRESLFDTNAAFSQYVNLKPPPVSAAGRTSGQYLVIEPGIIIPPDLFDCHEIMDASAFTRVSQTPDAFFL